MSAPRRGAVALGAAVLLHVGPGATWLPPVRRRWWPSLDGAGDGGHLALTFDDGPHPEGTPAVLARLADLSWRATFFLVGERVRAHPSLTARIVAEGHEVALHGDTHRYLLTRGPRSTYHDLGRGADSITAATGTRPRWFRPPYGVLTTAALVAARRLDLEPVLWSAWGKDWAAGASAESVLRELSSGILAGGTVLLHDSDTYAVPGSWRAAVGSLDLLAAEVERRGLVVGPLKEHGSSRRGRAPGALSPC